MAWGRMDDGFDDHPKVVALLDEDDLTTAGVAIGLWTLCWTWAHRNTRKRGKTPGLIPAGLPRRFFGQAGKDAVQMLVKHRLWDAVDDGGWLIHDFEDFLPTEETREARSEAGRRGAAARWAGHRKAADEAESDAEDGKLPSACHEPASNPLANDASRAPARWGPTPIPTPNPEEQNPPSEGLFDADVSKPPMKPRKRGSKPATRIPDDFAVTDAMVAWAAEEVPLVDGRFETGNFIDYWKQATKNDSKRDWAAAWRVWMRKAQKDAEGRGVTQRWNPNSNHQGRASSELARRSNEPPKPNSPADQRIADAIPLWEKYKRQEMEQENARG